MLFTYNSWEKFCRQLHEAGMHGVTAEKVYRESATLGRFVSLKHDVESRMECALALAEIEAKYGHKATYYVQAYLLTESNMTALKRIQELGHEVSYHYEVMDACKGDVQAAMVLFTENKDKFEAAGFPVVTTCQHGTALSVYENRDFFRSEVIRKTFPDLTDIMVDFAERIAGDYIYISDAGMTFKEIYDPANNDKLPIGEKNRVIGNLDKVFRFIQSEDKSIMISSHPHRYYSSTIKAAWRKFAFTVIRGVGKGVYKTKFGKWLAQKLYFIQKMI